MSDAKITQWKGAVDTELGADIQQFSVHYTIFWSSYLHHGNGFTEARSIYAVDNGIITCVGNEILKTNGTMVKGDASKGLTGLIVKYAIHLL